MAKRKAKAALAPQALTVSGVARGTTTISVESVSDATKKDSISVEVVDFTIDTKGGYGNEVKVGGTVTDELVIETGELPEAYKIRWFATYDEGQDGSFTLEPQIDGMKCVVRGVKEGGGGRVNVEVSVQDIEEVWSGSTRVNVVAGEPSAERIEFFIADKVVTDVTVQVDGNTQSVGVRFQPSGATDGWEAADFGDAAIAKTEIDGAYLVVNPVAEGKTSVKVQKVGNPNISATLAITVNPA